MEIFLTILAFFVTAMLMVGAFAIVAYYFYEEGFAPSLMNEPPRGKAITVFILTFTILPVGLMMIRPSGSANVSINVGEYFFEIADEFGSGAGKWIYTVFGCMFVYPHKYPGIYFGIGIGNAKWASASYFIGAAAVLTYFVILIIFMGNAGALNSEDRRQQAEYDRYNATVPKKYRTTTTTTYSGNIWRDDVFGQYHTNNVKATTTTKTEDVTKYKYVTPWWFVAFPGMAVASFLIPVTTFGICIYFSIIALVLSIRGHRA